MTVSRARNRVRQWTIIDFLPEKPERVARIPARRYAGVWDLSEVIAFLQRAMAVVRAQQPSVGILLG